jgi:hypothetical protein
MPDRLITIPFPPLDPRKSRPSARSVFHSARSAPFRFIRAKGLRSPFFNINFFIAFLRQKRYLLTRNSEFSAF